MLDSYGQKIVCNVTVVKADVNPDFSDGLKSVSSSDPNPKTDGNENAIIFVIIALLNLMVILAAKNKFAAKKQTAVHQKALLALNSIAELFI